MNRFPLESCPHPLSKLSCCAAKTLRAESRHTAGKNKPKWIQGIRLLDWQGAVLGFYSTKFKHTTWSEEKFRGRKGREQVVSPVEWHWNRVSHCKGEMVQMEDLIHYQNWHWISVSLEYVSTHRGLLADRITGLEIFKEPQNIPTERMKNNLWHQNELHDTKKRGANKRMEKPT